jgi:hypothetical protein
VSAVEQEHGGSEERCLKEHEWGVLHQYMQSTSERLEKIERWLERVDQALRNGLAARVSGIAAQVRIQWLIMGAALLTLVGMAIAAALQQAALP